MTLAAAAMLLGVTPSTLRQQASKGVLRTRRHGKIYVVDADEVERYRAEHLGRPGQRREGKDSKPRRPSGIVRTGKPQ